MKKVILIAVVFVNSVFCLNAQTNECDIIRQALLLSYKMKLQSEEEQYFLQAYNLDEDCCAEAAMDTFIKMAIEHNLTKNLSEFEKIFTDVFDQNSIYYNESWSYFLTLLEERCGLEAMPEIVVTGPLRGSVPLLPSGNAHKIKVTIGNSTKYYLLDSGADYCAISFSYANDLINDGYNIEESAFLGAENLLLADGRTVYSELYLLDGVKIGDFTLDNVVFAFINEDINFLLGKNVLNAFKSATINNKSSSLDLVK